MKLYNKNELKNSRIFFDTKPPRFMMFFGYVMLFLLVLCIQLANKLGKTYIVKAQGNIESQDKVYVTAKANATIEKIYKKENDYVKKNETLLTLNDGTNQIQTEELAKQLNYLKKQHYIYNLYQKSLDEQVNYLINEASQQEFYGKVQYFLKQLKSESRQTKLTLKDLARKKNKCQQLKNEVKKYENIKDNTKKEEIKMLKTELSALEQEIEQIEVQLKSSDSMGMHDQLISELGAQRLQTKQKAIELKAQYNVQAKIESNLTIKATSSGYLHYYSNPKDGLAIQVGQVLGQIETSKKDNLFANVYIDAIDYTKIKLNQRVKVAIVGVNQTKYGTISGKVTEISKGTIIRETPQGNQILYQVKAMLENYYLEDKDENNRINLAASLPVEIQIIYNNETYLDWIFDQLNFKK